jgi:hypothetical protein
VNAPNVFEQQLVVLVPGRGWPESTVGCTCRTCPSRVLRRRIWPSRSWLANPQAVDRLVLSSTGPADYGRAWLPVDCLAIGLVRLLPEQRVKRLLAGQLGKVLTTDPKDREDWRAAGRKTLEHDLTRADVVSHLGVAADIITTRLVRPGALHAWNGRAVVLRADNYLTQGRRDRPRCARLFDRHVETISMGHAGHAAASFDPPQYVHWWHQALARPRRWAALDRPQQLLTLAGIEQALPSRTTER